MYAKLNKCEFGMRSVTFLGNVVSDQSVKVDPRKTEAVKNWPKPLTPKDICSFLGLAPQVCRGLCFHCCPTDSFDEEECKVRVDGDLGEEFPRAQGHKLLQPRFLLYLSVVRVTLYIVMHLGLV